MSCSAVLNDWTRLTAADLRQAGSRVWPAQLTHKFAAMAGELRMHTSCCIY